MDGWSGDPVPVEFLNGRSPLERQGALVFQVKQCRNCHSIGGSGGKRGPALDSVATALTRDQLVRQVIQGGGNMPAYGKNLNPAEVTALVSFLETLHPSGHPPARDASQAVVTKEERSHPRGQQPLSSHAIRLSSCAALVVDSSGCNVRPVTDSVGLPARDGHLAPRGFPRVAAVASQQFCGRAVLAVVRTGFARSIRSPDSC